MGWNSAEAAKESKLLIDIPKDALYYFVHSYHFNCNDTNDILARTIYDYPFTSAIQKNNIYGTQFHPEKSHDWGQKLINNFINL